MSQNKGIQFHHLRQTRSKQRDIDFLVAIHDFRNVSVLVETES